MTIQMPTTAHEVFAVQQDICLLLPCVCAYPLVCATGGGSRIFGTASPDSDYDIHGIHLLPLDHLLGLTPHACETMEIKCSATPNRPKVEIATHDIRKFVRLLLKGNCNVLEDLYSPMVFVSSPVHERLQRLGHGCITRKIASCYKEMAYNQQRALHTNTVKKFLHMYRCLLMGIFLMQQGEIEMSVPTLATLYGYPEIHDLIALKNVLSEQPYVLTERAVMYHLVAIESLTHRLEHERERSTLPEEPTDITKRELEQLLLDARKGNV